MRGRCRDIASSYLVKMHVILDLKGGGPEVTSKQSDTYDIATMVGEKIQPLRNMFDGNAGPGASYQQRVRFLLYSIK